MAKIPSHATKVFSGVIFDVYQWEQELFNGEKTTFEGGTRPSVVVVIPVVGDKIVLAHERQPGKDRYTTLISGCIELGEEPLLAAKRELEEEAGIVSDNWQLYKEFPVGGKIVWSVYYYVVKDCDVHGQQNLDSGGEEIEIFYVSFEEFINFVQSEKCQNLAFANHIFRLEKEGRLEEFREVLFG